MKIIESKQVGPPSQESPAFRHGECQTQEAKKCSRSPVKCYSCSLQILGDIYAKN